MKRAAFLVPLLCAASLLTCSKGPPRGNGHDFVLFVIDTLRADHLGCYGYTRATSPTLDRFASEGTRAAHCFAQSSWTAPSIVSLMTSHAVADDFVKMPPQATLAERLQRAGYATTAFQFNTLLAKGNGFERGFDEYLDEPGADQILARLEAPSDRPRFFYFHFVEPHDPYLPPAQWDVFPPLTLPDVRLAQYARYLKQLAPGRDERDVEKQVKRDAKAFSEQIAKYDGEVLEVDSMVSTTLEVLRRHGRLDSTIVAIGADHGECLWQHREAEAVREKAVAGGIAKPREDLASAFKMTHNSLLFEELLRVPLLWRGPGVPKGAVIEPLCANLDLVPTALELLGLPLPDDVEGRSLVPAMQPGSAGRDLVFAHTSVFTSARSRSGMKLIVPWKADGPDPAMLFDLNADPQELNPLPLEGDAFHGLDAAIRSFREHALRAANAESTIDPETARRMKELGY